MRSVEEMRRLSALLDEALERPPSERDGWLDALPADPDGLKPALRSLLERASRETDDLLDRGPAFLPPAAGPAAGTQVGAYRLLRELGSGGMGSVWLAERADGPARRQVALKLPHAGWSPALAERFERECGILASLEHPNIARLYDAGADAEGRPFMALEYVEGRPIDVYCRERGLGVPERLRLLLQVADAVAFAHGRLVLHRDLKPGNILVTADGQVRLLDFGIAKLMDDGQAAETALTRAAGRALTLDYASPEQIRGEPLGTASDVYSLGVVAFELLAGERPYRLKRGTAAELEEAITDHVVPLASAVAPDAGARQVLRGDLDSILNKALKKDPAERYATVDALAQDWRSHLQGRRVQARPDTWRYRVSRFVARRRVPLAAGTLGVAGLAVGLGLGATALVILALAIGLGVATWQARRAARARDRALALNARNEAVSEFLNALITQAARSGEPITAAQLLERSEALVAREFKDDPELHAVVLAMMGMNSHSLGDPARAVALLERALVLVRGSADRALREKLVIQHALSIGWIGRLEEARATLQSIVARGTAEAEEMAEAHHYLASLAHQSSDAEAAMLHAREALRWFRRTARPGGRMETSLIASLGHSCYLSGRNDEAERHYVDAFERLQARGQARNAHAIALLNNWAITTEGAGDAAKAIALYEQAMAIAAVDTPEAPKSPFMTVNRARALELMGRLDEADAGYREALQLAESMGVPPVRQFARTGLASLAVARGDAAAAREWLADTGPAAPPGSKVALARALVAGRLALLAGDAGSAVAVSSDLVGDRLPLAATVLGLLSRAQAQLQLGRADAARADVADALALAQRLQGRRPASLHTGLAWLASARLAAAAGQADDAHAHAVQALRQLEAAADERHPALAEARALAGR